MLLLVMVLGSSLSSVQAVPPVFEDDDSPPASQAEEIDEPYYNEDNPYWESDMGNYNCYGYAIDLKGLIIPGFTQSEDDVSAIGVRKDLIALGYEHVVVSTTFIEPVNSDIYVIAFRKGPIDFHFMKYDSYNDVWTHKPGTTAVLTFKTEFFEDVWISESYKFSENQWYKDESYTYNQTIYYIYYEDGGDEGIVGP